MVWLVALGGCPVLGGFQACRVEEGQVGIPIK